MKFSVKNPELLTQSLLKLERSGRYEEAVSKLNDIWEDTNKLPNVESFEPKDAAEIILRCGSLIGFLGHNKQLPDSQEKSKNLLTEARNRFLDIYNIEKIAECETYLAMAYWRTGELVEAEVWIEEALSHKIPLSKKVRLYSLIIKSLIFLSLGKHNENINLFNNHENYFLKYGDAFLKGNFYSNFGISLRNTGQPHEALEKYKLAKFFFTESGHRDYLGAVENNLAYLYKSFSDFVNAHQSVDNAVKIYEEINDKTRKGSSLDTKANLYFDERNFDDALSVIDESIRILQKGENAAYLVESILTKSKILIFQDDIASASLCLSEGIEIAKSRISEDAAKNLAKEFEIAIRKKTLFSEHKDSVDDFEKAENLKLVLPASLAHYENYQAVRIKNDHLKNIGLTQHSLAIVVKEKVKNGDLAALIEIASDSIICGFYDSYFGTVSINGVESDPVLFNEEEVKILGKIVGVGTPENAKNNKIYIEPIKTLS